MLLGWPEALPMKRSRADRCSALCVLPGDIGEAMTPERVDVLLDEARLPATASKSKTTPGTLGIHINYTPVTPQPSTLPNSSPQPWKGGSIKAVHCHEIACSPMPGPVPTTTETTSPRWARRSLPCRYGRAR